MAMRRCALTLALVLGLAFSGSSLHLAGVSADWDKCMPPEGDETQGNQARRIECMDKMCDSTGCGSDLLTVTNNWEAGGYEEQRRSVKGVLKEAGGLYGFVWTGYVFPGQHLHDQIKGESPEWEAHHLTPKHTLSALEKGLRPIKGYTIDMTPFGKWGMKFVPYGFCKNEKREYNCDEGRLYKKMWTVASSLYAETILEGGLFGILANGRNRVHLANGVMVKTEIPTILSKIQNNIVPAGKKLQVVVYNQMDVHGAGLLYCNELEGITGSMAAEFAIFKELKEAVEAKGGTYQCFDCQGKRKEAQRAGGALQAAVGEWMASSLHLCMNDFQTLVAYPADGSAAPGGAAPTAASRPRRWHLKRLLKMR